MNKEQLFKSNPEQFMLKCGICGKEFLPISYKQYDNLTKKARKYGRKFYCSDECRLLSKGTKKCKCETCGKEYYVSKYDYEHRKHHFCSKQCWLDYRKEHIENNYSKESICKFCGNKFITSKGSSSKYCSSECQHNDIIKNIDNKIENNISVSQRSLKNYLLRHYHKCMNPKCKWNWNNEEENPILELHHIDGDASNTVLSNCILLCPNCHSLTDTYKNKGARKSARTYRKKYYNQ